MLGLAGSAYRVQSQDAVDVAVVARKSFVLGPASNDAFAFIEVSDTTYETDRRYKIPLYVTAKRRKVA